MPRLVADMEEVLLCAWLRLYLFPLGECSALGFHVAKRATPVARTFLALALLASFPAAFASFRLAFAPFASFTYPNK